jgi:RNA polymerase sigma-70 factor (ECF subfamily)
MVVDIGSPDELLDRLRSGDEQAFVDVVERYHPQLVRLAGAFVATVQAAEDVAQETWIVLLRGIDRFEGRSSLRTWLFQVCVNRARTTGVREHRVVPMDAHGPAAESGVFARGGSWAVPPTPWGDEIEDSLRDARTVARIREAVLALPTMQRAVVTLRDIDGCTADQVCEILTITAVNQRVLLHRGRERVRRSITEAAMHR